MKTYLGGILVLAFFCSAFLFFGKGVFGTVPILRAENIDIVINEIGAYEESGHEWVEIFNKGEKAVDLADWKFWEAETNHGLSLVQGENFVLESGEFALIVQNDVNFVLDYPEVTSTIFDSSWGALNESGEEIGIKDAGGEFVERFIYIEAGEFSLERIDVGLQDYTDTNWVEHEEGNTVGGRNFNVKEVGESEQEEDDIDDNNIDDNNIGDVLENVLINEFVADPGVGEEEWVELYNGSDLAVDFGGWIIRDGVGVVFSLSGSIEADKYFLVELSSSKFNNGGDVIILENDAGGVVDSVTYGDWDDGDLSDNAFIAPDGGSVARLIDGLDSGVDIDDFGVTTMFTPGGSNIIVPPLVGDDIEGNDDVENNTDDSNHNGGGGSVPVGPEYRVGEIVINELVSDPADGEVEFVELVNNTNGVIDLSKWWIEDGSEARSVLSGSISKGGFFVLEKPKGNLNNKGDVVLLFSPDGREMDSVTYGDWDDGNKSDNAPAPDDPLSLVRKVDGQDSNNDFFDFVLTATVTKGNRNIVSRVSKNEAGNEFVVEELVNEGIIVISEIFPNPAGSDAEDEFVEIFNLGSDIIDLSGWKLGDGSKKRFTISEGNIKSGEYFVFKRSITGIALNNSGGDEVKLYSPSGKLFDSVSYNSAFEDESYARREDGTFVWTTKVTGGSKNIIEGKSSAPIISIDVDTEVVVGELVMFDASDTTDPDGEEIMFEWNFDDGGEETGDVVAHEFVKEGVYTVVLHVVDVGGSEAEKKVIITVKNRLNFVGGFFLEDAVDKIEISEVFPNPEGSDTTEFIELYNSSLNEISLVGLKLDDEEGGSRAYAIPDDVVIGGGEYLVFGRQDTKLALNNTSDSVRLLYPDGTIITEISYDDVLEGASYVLDENGFGVWTSTVTAGKKNVISNVVDKVSVRKVVKSSSKRVKSVIETTLGKVRDEDIGDLVKVRGVVAVLPGVLSTQYFYIVSPKSSTALGQGLELGGVEAGVQVYSFKKDFPSLSVGDIVEVTAEISNVSGNTRLKVSQKSDIKKLDHGEMPLDKKVEIQDLGEPFEGALVSVHGEVTDIKGSYMFVDDGTEEIKVYFKRGAGIVKNIYKLGDLVFVVGILEQTKSGYQLLPRDKGDIVKTGIVEDVVVLRESIEKEDEKEVAEKYLTATAGGLTSILIGMFVKGKGGGAGGVVKRVGLVILGVVRRRRR